MTSEERQEAAGRAGRGSNGVRRDAAPGGSFDSGGRSNRGPTRPIRRRPCRGPPGFASALCRLRAAAGRGRKGEQTVTSERAVSISTWPLLGLVVGAAVGELREEMAPV